MLRSTVLGISGGGNRFDYSHTLHHPLVDGSVSNTVFLDPHGKGFGHASDFNESRIASIDALLSPRRPTAVVGGVVSVRVDTVEGVFCRRGFAHVCKEVLESLPAVANRYSAPSVELEKSSVRVPAAGFHVLPSRVNLRPRFAMRHQRIANRIKANTSARPGMSAANLVATHKGFSAAVAATEPRGLTFTLRSFAGENNKVSEPLSGHVNELRHTMLQSNYGDSIIHLSGDAA